MVSNDQCWIPSYHTTRISDYIPLISPFWLVMNRAGKSNSIASNPNNVDGEIPMKSHDSNPTSNYKLVISAFQTKMGLYHLIKDWLINYIKINHQWDYTIWWDDKLRSHFSIPFESHQKSHELTIKFPSAVPMKLPFNSSKYPWNIMKYSTIQFL